MSTDLGKHNPRARWCTGVAAATHALGTTVPANALLLLLLLLIAIHLRAVQHHHALISAGGRLTLWNETRSAAQVQQTPADTTREYQAVHITGTSQAAASCKHNLNTPGILKLVQLVCRRVNAGSTLCTAAAAHACTHTLLTHLLQMR
jgi:hypothetical protein